MPQPFALRHCSLLPVVPRYVRERATVLLNGAIVHEFASEKDLVDNVYQQYSYTETRDWWRNGKHKRRYFWSVHGHRKHKRCVA